MPPAPHVLTLASRVYRALRYAAASPYYRGAYFSVLSLIAMWPTLGHANALNDFKDAQYFQLYEEVARLSVARFHQLPLWDPYYCGGLSGVGTPSARFVSPTFLLTLAFGTLRGEALAAWLMTLVGLEGTFRFVRARGGGALAAMMAAPVFALSGVFARSEVLGWTNFFGFELVPWALYGVRLALDGSRRGVVVASVAMAWMIGLGGTYTGPLTVLAATFETLALVVRRARRPRALGLMAGMGLTVALLAASLSAVRLWPIAETLTASPRILGGTPATSLKEAWDFLFGARSAPFWRDDFLVGLPVLPLVALGLWRRRALPLVLAGALSLWLALGYGVHYSLFGVLRTVPPFTMLRAPERFLVFVALALAAIAAIGVRRVEAAARRRPGMGVLALACVALLAGDTALLIKDQFIHAAGRQMVPAPAASDDDFRQMRGNRWLAAYFPYMNRGTLTCFDDYDIAQSADLRGDLPAEEFLRDAGSGTVKRAAWSPNRIDLKVTLTRPARVYVNQNWHPGWRASAGSVVSDGGLLAVDLPAGVHDLTLRYLPRSGVGGVGMGVLGLVAAALLLWRSRRDDLVRTTREWGGTAALCLAPFAAGLLTVGLMHEPRRPPAPLVTPDNEPMIVDAPPAGTTPVNARFAQGILLQAGRVQLEPRSDGRGTRATLELDWRLDHKLPPGLGVFVRFEKPGTQHVGADHVLLSSVMLPEAAPVGRTIRDFSQTITLPPSKEPSTWTVRAGVWWARRDETRLEVIDPGSQPAPDRAVFVTDVRVP